MECLQGALKTCFSKEMGVKLSPQVCFDENGCFNAQNVVSCDDFFVDELLDLSNEDEFVEQQVVEEEEEDKGSASISLSEQQLRQDRIVSAAHDLPSLPTTSELSVPADDLADLEWLSHFVEESFSGFSAPFPAGISVLKANEAAEEQPEDDGGSFSPPQPCFKIPVPVKARSKRTRTGGRVWCLGSPSLTESSSSSTTSSSSSSPLSPWLICQNSEQFEQAFVPEFRASKKPKKKWGTEKGVVQPPRRCSHCGVQKTPQWRTGPLGAKTLCNACGVRFKSGRLLPEYRPACSPSFSTELHSNHHRKVLEMRRKKEVTGSPDGALPSF